MLVKMGIREEEIAIKTSQVDELGNRGLMSRDCPIRYIITVNALKEGWDCPFAYILASLANKTSKVDVEQILGRILRQPYAKQHASKLLNMSYVLSCSNDFRNTLESIVRGLNEAGFSRRDFRVGEEEPLPADKPETSPARQPELGGTIDEEVDGLEEIDPAAVRAALESRRGVAVVPGMVQAAAQQADAYRMAMEESADSGLIGGELGEMLHQNAIQLQFREEAANLRIPQFCWETVLNLTGEHYDLLEKENLSDGFSLSGQDAQVNFRLSAEEIYHVDLQQQGEAIPKYRRASKEESEYLRSRLARLPKEEKREECVRQLCGHLERNDRYRAQDVAEYVRRVVANMTDDELTAMETDIPAHARKIQAKIDTLEAAYREMQFKKLLDSGEILCRKTYILPQVITPAETIDSIPDSLYEAEKDDMNPDERNLIDAVIALGNVRWWHRIIVGSRGFRLNGNINHFPDFMVMTKKGRLVLIEFKGDDRDNSDSKAKLALGRQWQAHAGEGYKYFMVFKNRNMGLDGAYIWDEFLDVMGKL